MSIKLQEEYGDDLQVLFVEVQGTDDAGVTAFALEKKWLGGRAMWTTERPFNLDLQGIPQFGLLAPDGELVLSGHTNAMTKQIDDTIEEMVKAARKPSKDLPKDVAKALVDANKGGYAKALAALDAVIADEGAADDHAAAQAVRDDVAKRVDGGMKRVAWMLDNGYPIQAAALLDDLQKGLKGAAHGAEELAALGERLASDAAKAELGAAKALVKIEEKLYADGPSEKAKRALEKLVEKHAGTKVAARATELARYAG